MNSTKMPESFARSNEMRYGAHYATLCSGSVSYENPVGRFVMTYATPGVSSSAYDTILPKGNTGNVINNDNLGVSRITTSNYIEIKVPLHFFYITDIKIKPNTKPCNCEFGTGLGSCKPEVEITRKKYYKGQRFVVVNAGGEVDTPCIVGVV